MYRADRAAWTAHSLTDPTFERRVLPKAPETIAVVAPNDHYAGPVDTMVHVGRQVHATSATIEAAGHWWMCEQPRVAASLLIKHWNSVGF